MGKLRDNRNAAKETALIDKIPRIEVELAGLASDLSDLELYVDEQVDAVGETIGIIDGAIYTNKQIISSDVIIPGNKNAMMVGPVELADGYTLTISDGATFVVI